MLCVRRGSSFYVMVDQEDSCYVARDGFLCCVVQENKYVYNVIVEQEKGVMH